MSAPAKRTVIFEPTAGGHQLYHVRLLADAALRAGLPLTLATTAAALDHASAAPLRAVLDAGGADILLTHPKLDAYGVARKLHPSLPQQFAQTDALRVALLEAGGAQAFAHVFVPFFDGYMTVPLAVRRDPCLGIPMSGILHRTRFHMPAMSVRTTLPPHVRAERFIYASVLRRKDVTPLFTMDPYLDRYYGGRRVRYLPDPATFAPRRMRDEVRRDLGIAPGRLCVLVYGMLDNRKAIGTLLRGVSALPDPSRVCVLVAGRQDTFVRETLASEPAKVLRARGVLVEVEGFLEDGLVDDLFLAADVCWICYSNSDGNSGVIVKAGQAERPVITARTGISARIVEDDAIGWQADPENPATATAVLQTLLDNPDAVAVAGAAIKRRFSGNTVENFIGPMVRHLRDVTSP